MEIICITFSPAGGTYKCASTLASSMSDNIRFIDLCKRDLQSMTLSPESIAIIAVPSYSGRVPALAIERLQKISGNGAKAVLMVVYGNRAYEDTLIELADVAKARGFNIVAGVSAVARHSIVNKIATNRPDSADLAMLSEFGREIIGKLSASTSFEPSIPGNHPYRKAGKGLVPKTSSQCNDCGKCAKLCPAGAIDPTNPRKIDKKVCINCVRCVEVCPIGAKHLSSPMVWIVGKVLKKPYSLRKEPELFL